MTPGRYGFCQQVLSARELLPRGVTAIAVVGSVARGWDTPASDLDLIVVSDSPFTHPGTRAQDVPLTPRTLPTMAFSHEGHRWEVKYWLDDQIDQVLAKVTWTAFGNELKAGDRLAELERILLERLLTCIPVTGEEWIKRRRDEIESSAFRSSMLVEALAKADNRIRAALGQLDAGDSQSAVVTARDAFGWAVMALMLDQGEYGSLGKWRVRQYRAVATSLLPFDEYWSYETMRNYDPADPGSWVRGIADLCKRVSMEVEI